MLPKIEIQKERPENPVAHSSLSETLANNDWCNAVIAESEVRSDASPVAVASSLIVIIRRADENLQLMMNTGMFGYLFGRKKYSAIRDNATKLAQTAIRLQKRLERS